MRVVLLRHGQTDWNVAARLQGREDVDLNQVGRAQAEAAAPLVAALRPQAIVSSDLRRAVDTARVVASSCRLDLSTDPRLREIDVGQWNGRTWAELDAEEPATVRAIREGQDLSYGGGERPSQVAQRIGDAVRDLADGFAGDTLLVVGHGMAIRVGIANLLGLDLAAGRVLGPMGNCGWSILNRHGDSWRLAAYNRQAAEA